MLSFTTLDIMCKYTIICYNYYYYYHNCIYTQTIDIYRKTVSVYDSIGGYSEMVFSQIRYAADHVCNGVLYYHIFVQFFILENCSSG